MMWQQIRLSVLVTTVLFLLGLLLMKVFLPPLPVVKLVSGDAQQWEIPTVFKQDPKLKVEQLISRTLWKEPATDGNSPAAEEKPLTPPDWRIAAVIKVGGSNQLVISFKDNPSNLQTLNVGDKLPGGFPIIRIEQNWIVISINGKHSMLSVGRN